MLVKTHLSGTKKPNITKPKKNRNINGTEKRKPSLKPNSYPSI